MKKPDLLAQCLHYLNVKNCYLTKLGSTETGNEFMKRMRNAKTGIPSEEIQRAANSLENDNPDNDESHQVIPKSLF
jgi:hypothetical protein